MVLPQIHIFKFNNKNFKKIDGIAKGSRLSPAIVDIAIEALEMNCLCSLSFNVRFYKRYFDDILMITAKQ